MTRTASERHEKIDGLTARYRDGDLSEPVYRASLRNLVDRSEERYLIGMHQAAHRESFAYRRGDIA